MSNVMSSHFKAIFLVIIFKLGLCKTPIILEFTRRLMGKKLKLVSRTYRARVLHHRVSEAVVALCFELQVVGAFKDHSFLHVTRLGVLVAHRVLAVVGDGLSCFFGEQTDEGHLHGDGVRRLIFVPVSELETQIRSVSAALKDILQTKLAPLDAK